MSEWVLLLIAAMPLLALWIRSVFEVVRRGDLSMVRRLTWILILVLIPVGGLAAYIVARTPSQTHVSDASSDLSRAGELVLLAERRQRGELDDAGFDAAVAPLRPG